MNPALVAMAAVVLVAFFSLVTWTMARDGWWVPVFCWGTGLVVTAALVVVAFAVAG